MVKHSIKDLGSSLELSGNCAITKKPYSVIVDKTQFEKYQQGNTLLQNCFPTKSPDERELIKSGITSEGWDKMCGI